MKRKCSCIEIGNCTITHFTVITITLDAIAMESPANCYSEQYSGFSPFEYWFLVQTFVYLRPHPQNRFVDSSLFSSVGHDRCKILTRKTGMTLLLVNAGMLLLGIPLSVCYLPPLVGVPRYLSNYFNVRNRDIQRHKTRNNNDLILEKVNLNAPSALFSTKVQKFLIILRIYNCWNLPFGVNIL